MFTVDKKVITFENQSDGQNTPTACHWVAGWKALLIRKHVPAAWLLLIFIRSHRASHIPTTQPRFRYQGRANAFQNVWQVLSGKLLLPVPAPDSCVRGCVCVGRKYTIKPNRPVPES